MCVPYSRSVRTQPRNVCVYLTVGVSTHSHVTCVCTLQSECPHTTTSLMCVPYSRSVHTQPRHSCVYLTVGVSAHNYVMYVCTLQSECPHTATSLACVPYSWSVQTQPRHLTVYLTVGVTALSHVTYVCTLQSECPHTTTWRILLVTQPSSSAAASVDTSSCCKVSLWGTRFPAFLTRSMSPTLLCRSRVMIIRLSMHDTITAFGWNIQQRVQ